MFVATLIEQAAGMPNAEVFTIEPPINRNGVDFGQVIVSTSVVVEEHMVFLAEDGKVADWTELASSHSTRCRGELLTDIGALQIRSAKHRRRIAKIGMSAFLDEYIPGVNTNHISTLQENYKRFLLQHQD